MIVYLDTSAIVKRYIVEEGSDKVSKFYEDALNGDLTLSFSLWNIGETIGIFDKYYRRGWITLEDYKKVLLMFRVETRRLIRLRLLKIVPVRSRLLVRSWKLITKYHVYIGDALQILSAKYVNADKLITSDRRLYDIAIAEGINSLYIGGK